MPGDVLNFPEPVTLVGGGSLERETLDKARLIAPRIIAADGAADRLADWDVAPDAIVGDMDSIVERARWESGPWAFRHLPEQGTTDFEKCLYVSDAPFYVGVGFTGRRLDHTLAVLHVMLARPEKRVVLLGEVDAIGLARPGEILELDVDVGATVSFFPLLPVTGVVSQGLRWPIDGLAMVPGKRIGTSNRASERQVRVGFDGPGMVVTLEQRHHRTLVAALESRDPPARS